MEITKLTGTGIIDCLLQEILPERMQNNKLHRYSKVGKGLDSSTPSYAMLVFKSNIKICKGCITFCNICRLNTGYVPYKKLA